MMQILDIYLKTFSVLHSCHICVHHLVYEYNKYIIAVLPFGEYSSMGVHEPLAPRDYLNLTIHGTDTDFP